MLDSAGVRRLYDHIAPIYDLAASLYTLVGGRRLAERGIDELRLCPGDTVVDLGTGTGWNLPRLATRVGPSGTVIGVDISPGMLEQATTRMRRIGCPAGIRSSVLLEDNRANWRSGVPRMTPPFFSIRTGTASTKPGFSAPC